MSLAQAERLREIAVSCEALAWSENLRVFDDIARDLLEVADELDDSDPHKAP